MTLDELLTWMHTEDGQTLLADLKAWQAWRPNFSAGPDVDALSAHLAIPEFMTLVDYRLSSKGIDTKFEPRRKRANDLYIKTPEIGGGLFIQHGYSTFILATSIGKNFVVNQNVTIGVGRHGKPIIGDNVAIRTGAVVVGKIQVGDNVRIGANCVVAEDIPANTSVTPARLIFRQRALRE